MTDNRKENKRIYDAAYYIANSERKRADGARWRVENKERYEAQQFSYRRNNAEQRRLNSARWRAANPGRHIPLLREWRRRNYEKYRAQISEWQSRNPGKVNAYATRRKAARLRATPAWANQFFIEEAYDLASRRTVATGYEWDVDHIVPLISAHVCGLHVEHNLQVIPASVNARKGNRHWPDMP